MLIVILPEAHVQRLFGKRYQGPSAEPLFQICKSEGQVPSTEPSKLKLISAAELNVVPCGVTRIILEYEAPLAPASLRPFFCGSFSPAMERPISVSAERDPVAILRFATGLALVPPA